MANVPHLQVPVRILATGSPATVTQGSPEEIAQCVQALCRTPVGVHDLEPYDQMGLGDQVFLDEPDTPGIQRQLDEHEPRTRTLLDTRPDLLDEALATINVRTASAA